MQLFNINVIDSLIYIILKSSIYHFSVLKQCQNRNIINHKTTALIQLVYLYVYVVLKTVHENGTRLSTGLVRLSTRHLSVTQWLLAVMHPHMTEHTTYISICIHTFRALVEYIMNTFTLNLEHFIYIYEIITHTVNRY